MGKSLVPIHLVIQLSCRDQYLAIRYGLMGDEVLTHYEGYFRVIVPPNLMKLLGGDIFKLRGPIDEYSKFLKEYGVILSQTEDHFIDDNDPKSWVYYTDIAYLLPVGKDPAEIIVKIETDSKDMFEDLLEGAANKSLKIFLKGTAIISNDGIDNVDKHLVDLKIKKIEAFWNGSPHSNSPSTDQPLKQAAKDLISIFDPSNAQTPDEVLDGDDDIPF